MWGLIRGSKSMPWSRREIPISQNPPISNAPMNTGLKIKNITCFPAGICKLHEKKVMPNPKPEIEPQPPTQPTQPPVIKALAAYQTRY